MIAPLVLHERRGLVSILTLNRPERRNALSRDLIEAVSDQLQRDGRDPDIRVAILTGFGSTFCAGMDLKETPAHDGKLNETQEKQVIADSQAIADLIDLVHKLAKPVVAVLNGDAYGGGAGLAVACDFVIAVESARIGYPEVRRGLVAAIVLHDLVRQIGDRRARALLLSGEPISAEQARDWGLVYRVSGPHHLLEDALDLARTLAAGGPRAIATTKLLLDESSSRPLNLRGSAAVSAAIRVSDEALEGVEAFLQKRPPAWAQDLGTD